jgi:hypothetical protein
VMYGYADASGGGFGNTLGYKEAISYTHGIWDAEGRARSSNYRELSNIVTTLEEGLASGQLRQSEVWLFTDNSVSESVLWRGHSSSPLLSSLILHLRLLEMSGWKRIHLVHVPGTRMIAQGTDGLSRGDTTEGVMAGRSMLDFVPLHLSAFRQPGVASWMQSWIPSSSIHFLHPEEWYDIGHGMDGGARDQFGTWVPHESSLEWQVWSPPPAIAEVALDELEESRHKRKHINHIWVAPWLMTYTWRKRLLKICDLVFSIPPGARPFWPLSEHEPLIVGLTLRFSSSSPWQTKFTAGVLDVERQLSKVWSIADEHERALLCEFCHTPEQMARMPECLV